MPRVTEAVKENECGGVRSRGLHDDCVEGTAAWTSLGGDQHGKCEAQKAK